MKNPGLRRRLAGVGFLVGLSGVALQGKAQSILTAEGGAGVNLMSIRKEPQYVVQNKFKSIRDLAFAVSYITAYNRPLNMGVTLSYSSRKFSYLSGLDTNGTHGVRCRNSYAYVTPTFDISVGKHHYFHIQALLPFGINTGGEDIAHEYRHDATNQYIIDTFIVTRQRLARVNVRVGASIYSCIPVTGSWAAMAKAEYTASMGRISSYQGFSLNPADLLFKVGVIYALAPAHKPVKTTEEAGKK